mgnify:FL=1
MENKKRTVRIIGPGKAGRSFGTVLERKGWILEDYLGRNDDLQNAAQLVDLLVIATPDEMISETAKKVTPNSKAVVAHLSGALGLNVLNPHESCMGFHPLASLPDPHLGADFLESGIWFGISGHQLAKEIAVELGGKYFVVSDADRPLYHAAATVASNHLTALLGQVERIALSLDIPLEAFLNLVSGTIKNIESLGSIEALTGPAARGDDQTITQHLKALSEPEHSLYKMLSDEARRLAEEKK